MKYTFTIAALAAFTAAQGIADLPSCSLSCVVSGVSQLGCSPTDFKCSCSKADELTPSMAPCLMKACPDTADQQKVVSVLGSLCASAGVPINIPEEAPSAAAPATSAEAPKTTAEAPKPTAEAPKPSETEAEAAPSSAAYDAETSAPAVSETEAASYAEPTASAESSCVEETVTVTATSAVAPYPVHATGTGVPVKPSGTGAYSAPASYFTGAAVAVKVPAAAGLLGLAAFIL